MSDELDLMPPLEGGDDLGSLLQQRAPRPRSKVTTALVVVLVLLVGVLIGVPLGKVTGASTPTGPGSGSAAPSGASGLPAASGAGVPPGAGGGAFGPGGGGGRGTAGTVTSVDGGTITVTADDGTELTVTTSDQTQITESREATVTDLVPGTAVLVIGESQDDGTLAADRIVAGDASLPGQPGMGRP